MSLSGGKRKNKEKKKKKIRKTQGEGFVSNTRKTKTNGMGTAYSSRRVERLILAELLTEGIFV